MNRELASPSPSARRALAIALLASGALAACSSGGTGSSGAGGSHAPGAEGGGAGAGVAGGAGGGGAGAIAGAGGAAGSGDRSQILADCEACELASGDPSCDPAFLSARKDSTGAPVGWGPGTLPSQAEVDTGVVLLRCLNGHGCASNPSNTGPGDNAALGCFCGPGVAAVDCISGAGVHGVCIAEYESAASATPGGPVPGSSLATFAAFIATAASDPTGPVGLAGNIERCAVNAPCPVCNGI